jgi:hypothetical protein
MAMFGRDLPSLEAFWPPYCDARSRGRRFLSALPLLPRTDYPLHSGKRMAAWQLHTDWAVWLFFWFLPSRPRRKRGIMCWAAPRC